MEGCVSIAQFPAPDQAGAVESHEMRFICADGVLLAGHLWRSGRGQAVVIVNPATGVLARYYHRYAAFLAERGFDVVTYDYRGIGASRPASLRGCGYRWRDWGTLDFAAVLDGAERMAAGRPIMVVGHSIGGFLPGLAQGFDRCAGMISVAAQFAYWRAYERSARLRLVLRWHLIMPLMTALMGYFPGRRLGWLEDLPAGVAYEWAFRGPRVERSFPPEDRDEILRRLAAFRGPLLAITTTDDPYGAPGPSIARSPITRAPKDRASSCRPRISAWRMWVISTCSMRATGTRSGRRRQGGSKAAAATGACPRAPQSPCPRDIGATP
ncbi:MAG TPA: alpha/beta fold hydrolase [Sphingomonadales bacterium]